MNSKIFLAALFATVVLTSVFPNVGAAYTPRAAIIYKNEGCGHCDAYLKQLTALFDQMKVSYQLKDMVNDVNARDELAREQDRLGVPFLLQGHLVITVDGQYALEGHFPIDKVRTFLTREAGQYSKFIVTQDTMTGENETFQVMNAKNEVKTCLPNQTPAECDAKQPVSGVGTTTQYRGVDVNAFEMAFVGAIILIPLGLVGFHVYEERKKASAGKPRE